MKIRINKNGSIIYVYNEKIKLDQHGKPKIARISNVEPIDGKWYAKIIDGTELGPYKLRSEAINKEIEYVENNLEKLGGINE